MLLRRARAEPFTIVVACVFALLLFGLYHFTASRHGGFPVSGNAGHDSDIHSTPEPQAPRLDDLLEELFKPIRHDFTSPFLDPSGSGTVYKHSNNIYTRPLRNDILILDVDTRYPEQLFDRNKPLSWEQLDTNNLITQAVFNHYIYAKIHGYDYHYYQPLEVPGHSKTWPKIHSIANLLPHYKFVVFLDADASFHHLTLPLEWLFNRWNITSQTSLALSRDPLNAECDLCDKRGIPMLNTGFIVVQNLPYTNTIFRTWRSCTSNPPSSPYTDCAHWKETWAHEQSVLSEYIRYDFNPSGAEIRELECGEANGFPGHPWYDEVDCTGRFVRHHTFAKGLMKETTSNATMQVVMQALKQSFVEDRGRGIVVEEGKGEGRVREDGGVGRWGDGGRGRSERDEGREREREVVDHV